MESLNEFYKKNKKDVVPSYEFSKQEKQDISRVLNSICKSYNNSLVIQKRIKKLLDAYFMEKDGHSYQGKIYPYKEKQKVLDSNIIQNLLLDSAPPMYREAIYNVTRSIMKEAKGILALDDVEYSLGNKDEGCIYVQKVDPKDKESAKNESSIISNYKLMMKSVASLPKNIAKVSDNIGTKCKPFMSREKYLKAHEYPGLVNAVRNIKTEEYLKSARKQINGYKFDKLGDALDSYKATGSPKMCLGVMMKDLDKQGVTPDDCYKFQNWVKTELKAELDKKAKELKEK